MKTAIRNMSTKAYLRMTQFWNDKSGSEATEKIGMVVVAVIIIGVIAGVISDPNNGIGKIFSDILSKASAEIQSIFP